MVNYQLRAVRMETYLEGLDLWEVVEEDYDVLSLPNNPIMTRIKNYNEKKTKKSKEKTTLNRYSGNQSVLGGNCNESGGKKQVKYMWCRRRINETSENHEK